MNPAKPTTTNLGTTGTLTADVNNPRANPPLHHHVGDADKMLMLQVGNEFRMHSTERFGSGANQVVGLDFHTAQANVPADGVRRTFRVPNDINVTWWAYENAGGQPYRGVSGEVNISLDANEHATGDFDFEGAAGIHPVQVTKGTFDLLGFTTSTSIRHNAPAVANGTFTGTFTGGPIPGAFNATQVSIEHHAPGPIPGYIEVQGRTVQSFPATDTFISVQLEDGAQGLVFDLSKSTQARVTFFTFPDHGFAYAIGGLLTFSSPPDSSQAGATLKCTFQKNDEPPFEFNGTLAVNV